MYVIRGRGGTRIWFAALARRWRPGDETSGHRGGGGRGAGANAEFREDAGDVALDGADADEEGVGDLAVGLAGNEQLQDLLLARCQW